MKKNKIFFILFTLVFSCVPIQNSYSANIIKSGSICKIKNQNAVFQSNNFTCVKSGKKLIWKKVSLFSAWSTKFNTEAMVNAALQSTDKYFGKVVPKRSYEFYIDNLLPEYDRNLVLQMLDYSSGAFKNVQQENFKAFVGSSHEWSKQTLNGMNLWLGDKSSQFPCSEGINDVYCADKNLILLVFKKPASYWSIGVLSTPAHEVFHTIQHSLTGEDFTVHGGTLSDFSARRIPRWLTEGSANYFGYYIVDKLGFHSYENGRNNQVRFNSEYRNIKPLSTYDNFESNPYGIGQAATEYIIASVGFESLLNIFKFTGTEGTFSAGFKKATGIKLSEFYSKFEDSRKNMKIGN
jgi:hypothetical protein